MLFELAENPLQLDLIRILFSEYQQSLSVNLCFQNFEQELESLPGKYSFPMGRLYLVSSNGALLGCVALRALDEQNCEMKRLYIRPEFRGQGSGRLLVEKIISEAQAIGYKKMYLDTLPEMQSAIALYKAVGFVESEPYCFNPVCGAIYMVLNLEERKNV